MRRRATRPLRCAVLAAGIAALGAGTASAQPAEPGDLNRLVNGIGGEEAESPATVCNNDVGAGPILVDPCFDSSQFPPVDVDEVGPPAPELPGSGGVPLRGAAERPPVHRAPVVPPPEFGRGQDVNEPVMINDLGRLPEVPSVPAPGSDTVPAPVTPNPAALGLPS